MKPVKFKYHIRNVFFLSILCFTNVYAQVDSSLFTSKADFTIIGSPDKRIEIPFKLVHNLVVIELSINGSQPLNFILDSGVGSMLITELPNGEEINLIGTRVVTIAGLGVGEPKRAFLSTENEIRFKRVIGNNVNILFLIDDSFSLSNHMGMYIHGLIGYDIFANFAVEIDYIKKRIFLYKPEYFVEKFKKLPKHRKWFQYPIQIENKKPYMQWFFRNSRTDNYHPLNLLIDSGASSAFSFYANTSPYIHIPEKNIPVLIGVGLSGQVPGVLGQVEEVRFHNFKFHKPIVSYPDSDAVDLVIQFSDRNGSLGAEILKRFKVIFHYQMESIFLRKNSNFNDKFAYNFSGLDIITPYPNFPVYMIYNIRSGSVAERVGLLKGDLILEIDDKKTITMSLTEILERFEKRERLKLEIDRNGKIMSVYLDLKNELQLNE